jgi:hypothetical protein
MSEAAKKIDVMNSLLFSTGARDLPQVEELKSMLYRIDGSEEGDPSADSPGPVMLEKPGSDRVKVDIGLHRAKIKIKIPHSLRSELAIEHVVEAATDAINEKLKKVMT